MNSIKKSQLILSLALLVVIIFLLYSIFFTNLKIAKKKDPTLVNFDTFTTHVQGGEFNFLKMNLSLKMENKEQKSRAIENKEQIRHYIINIASSQDGRVLLSPNGKDKFKAQIEKRVEQDFNLKIEKIYFTDFVLAD